MVERWCVQGKVKYLLFEISSEGRKFARLYTIENTATESLRVY